MRRAYPYAWLEQETVCGLEMILHTHCSLFVCCLYMCMSHAERVALRIVVACATEGPGQAPRCVVSEPALVFARTLGDDLHGGWVVSMSRAA